MKSLVALLLTFGFFQLQIAKAQDVTEPCPDEQTDTEMLEGEAKGEVETEGDFELKEEREGSEYELKEETEDSDLKINEDEDEARIEYETDEFIYEEKIDKKEGKVESDLELKDQDSSVDMETETEVETETEIESDVESNVEMESDQYYQGTSNIETSDMEIETVEVEDDESTLENVIEAPFKAGFTLVSEVGEGVGHVVKGTAEGAGHIVGAPFKAIGKLFGRDDDDDNDM